MNWENPATYIAIVTIAGLVFAVGRWVGSVNTFRETVEKTLTAIKEDIKEIKGDIKRILERLPPTTVAGESPLKLTELGKSISKKLEADAWSRRTASALTDRVQEKTPYEIQEFCFQFVKKGAFNPSDELLRRMQDCAGNHAVSLEQVQDVFAVELRDAFMELAMPG